MMRTPFEELEFLADYLPDEGEAVLISRQQGELVCEPTCDTRTPDAIQPPELLGRLTEANERLKATVSVPVWTATLGVFWQAFVTHQLVGLEWAAVFWNAGLILMLAFGTGLWIRQRQQRLFEKQLRPVLEWQLRVHQMDRYRLIAALRDSADWRPLLRRLIDLKD